MNNRKILAPLLLVAAVVLAGVVAFGAKYYISNKANQAAASKTRTAPVVVALQDLPAGTELKADHLAVVQWPIRNRPVGHFRIAKPLVGRVLHRPVVKAEPILAGKLAPKGMSSGMAAAVRNGMRAVTVNANEVVGVAGYLKPGDRVDVIATVNTAAFSKDPTSRLVLQDVEVLAVEHSQQRQGKKKPRFKGQVVTLLVEPVNVERLALATTNGKILLALRNRGDHTTATTAGINMSSLFPQAVNPAAKLAALAAEGQVRVQKPPPKPPTVEIIKGVTRTKQEIKL